MAKDDEMKESGNGVPPLFSESQDTPIGFFDSAEPDTNLTGEIWQKESFDHIVRSEKSLGKFREYIRGHMGKNSGETPLPPSKQKS